MIVPSFTAKGGITSVVSGYRDSALEKNYQIRYIETYCDGGKAKKLCKAITAYAAFFWELLFFKPDLIHVHSAFGASFYRKMPFVYLASWLGIPVVNHVHGSELGRFYQEASEIKRSIVRAFYDRCCRVIVLSDYWKTQLSEFISSEKIEVIENYSIPARKSGDPRETDGRMVLFLGFLSERKGCMDIPKVAAQVSKAIDHVQFILAGSGRPEDIQRIKTLAQEYGSADYLVFPGWVKGAQKDELLRKASVFFLPSYAEGMPMSILEAMGYGLPIVSTTVGGIPQLVTDGENGFLCKPGDADGMANAVIALLKNFVLRKKMGSKSLDVAKSTYSIDRHCSRLMELYGECCNDG